MKQDKKVKVIIKSLTVAEQKTVKPGKVLELDSSEARILINSNKAKEYEDGDEKKFSYSSPKKAKASEKEGDKK